MKCRSLLIVVGVLAFGLLGCNAEPPIPKATPEEMSQRLAIAKKVVAAVEAAPPAERGRVARSFGKDVTAVKNCGDADLLARWKKAFEGSQ